MTDETQDEGQHLYEFYASMTQNSMCNWRELGPKERGWWASMQDAVHGTTVDAIRAECLYVCDFIRETGRRVLGEAVPEDDPEREIKLAIHGGVFGAMNALAEMIERGEHIPDSAKEKP